VAQLLRHEVHGLGDVVEEGLVASAQIVQPRLTVGRQQEAVLRAAAVTGKAYVTVQAELGESGQLVQAELPLLRRRDELDHRRLEDVAQAVVGLDEVIARIQVAVVLQRERVAARRRVDA